MNNDWNSSSNFVIIFYFVHSNVTTTILHKIIVYVVVVFNQISLFTYIVHHFKIFRFYYLSLLFVNFIQFFIFWLETTYSSFNSFIFLWFKFLFLLKINTQFFFFEVKDTFFSLLILKIIFDQFINFWVEIAYSFSSKLFFDFQFECSTFFEMHKIFFVVMFTFTIFSQMISKMFFEFDWFFDIFVKILYSWFSRLSICCWFQLFFLFFIDKLSIFSFIQTSLTNSIVSKTISNSFCWEFVFFCSIIKFFCSLFNVWLMFVVWYELNFKFENDLIDQSFKLNFDNVSKDIDDETKLSSNVRFEFFWNKDVFDTKISKFWFLWSKIVTIFDVKSCFWLSTFFVDTKSFLSILKRELRKTRSKIFKIFLFFFSNTNFDSNDIKKFCWKTFFTLCESK